MEEGEMMKYIEALVFENKVSVKIGDIIYIKENNRECIGRLKKIELKHPMSCPHIYLDASETYESKETRVNLHAIKELNILKEDNE